MNTLYIIFISQRDFCQAYEVRREQIWTTAEIKPSSGAISDYSILILTIIPTSICD